MTPTIIYAFAQHPDRDMGREKLRHRVRPDRRRTVCGQKVVWLFDYATPLAPDCRKCQVLGPASAAAGRLL